MERDPHIVNALRSKALETRSLHATLEVLARELNKRSIESLSRLLPMYYFIGAFTGGIREHQSLRVVDWYGYEYSSEMRQMQMQRCFEELISAWEEERPIDESVGYG